MHVTPKHLAVMNIVLQLDNEGKARHYPLAELSLASDCFKEIMKNTKGEEFVEGNIDLNSEQKVFVAKLVEGREWTVGEAETVFELKELLK